MMQSKMNEPLQTTSITYTDVSCLRDYGLKVREYYVLKRNGINTIEELAAMSDKDILDKKAIGTVTLDKIRSAMYLKQNARLIPGNNPN